MKKRILAIVLCAVMIVAMAVGFTACGGDADTYTTFRTLSALTSLKVGAIMVGDETEGYTKAHMDGIAAAEAAVEAELGKTIDIVYKKKVGESADCTTAAQELVSAGSNLVITNSYGHQFYIDDVVKHNGNVTFVSMTGDLAAGTGAINYKNAFTKIFESRYVSGIVAGLKLKEMVDGGIVSPTATPDSYTDGKIEIGYVGAYNYAEVVSGYTAFFLGMQSIVGDTIKMHVQYTNSWFDFDAEKQVATALIGEGCVIIGQHADSEGAPTACEQAKTAGNNHVYSVGYNVSMLTAAPNAALTSASNVWKVYYEYLFKSLLNGTEPVTNWSEGYSSNAVEITALGTSVATGTEAAVATAISNIKNGTIRVFDCSKFTVKGQNLTSYTNSFGMNGAECLKTENGITYFDESVIRSAPYFDLRIDGITETGAAQG